MIMFLDIDGVLNSTTRADKRPFRGFIPPSTAVEVFTEEWINQALVARLRAII